MENFKKFMVVFWAAWWFLALWTDIAGGLKHLAFLNVDWVVDRNYPFLLQSLEMYPIPEWLPPVLFCGIILWSFVITGLFVRACLVFGHPMTVWLKRAEKAFIASMGLWMAFFIADQITMLYRVEENHMVQASFQLLSFLSLYVLPNGFGRDQP